MVGMIDPSSSYWQPQPPPLSYQTKPTTAPGAPTFQPPKPQADPRIDDLIAQLQRQSTAAQAPRNSQVDDLVAQLMRGGGPSPGDLSSDPEAAAYRATRLRETDQARGAEAERLAASGFSGSGDFDARTAQLREAAGSDIAGFNAGLTNRRRQEMTTNALNGAQLSLSADAAMREEAIQRSQSEQQLLAQLIGQQQSATSQSQSAAAEAERIRQQNEELRMRQQEFSRTPAAYPFGTKFDQNGMPVNTGRNMGNVLAPYTPSRFA